MATKTKQKWFVRRKIDGRILCTDNKFRHNCGSIERIKFYSSIGWVDRAMNRLRVWEWEATCMYPGDVVNCCGKLERQARRRVGARS